MAALALSEVFDLLPISSVTWSIQRNDEFDSLGSGDVWQAELAAPLWTAEVTLATSRNDQLTQVAAVIRSLDGVRTAFLVCDLIRQYPLLDPEGTAIAGRNITVREIGTDRVTARMTGFPAGYQLSPGDKLQITYGDQIAFAEVSRPATADANGNLDAPIFPRLPLAVASGMAVILIRPACPVVIVPESHNPGEAKRTVTSGAGFKVIQKRRV
ncbi:hypothetical protein [Agrobacterium vitis]|uniref:hypothetical protein n=1 Tax=Agrobacterium vitis TaxID=373 RepID=UPI0015730338|nr:hypothetical protein [Agrobacterium vitis]NSZ17335.1 hypothetical protein [Agrobacterium vitis]QZO03043.1 hypothetical protein K4831_11360 [Agrobacterium vitis]UJL88165.1 hypothetical protein AVF2S5_09700 [Agrobacterium vitis]